MKSIKIKNSYDVWRPRDHRWYANREVYEKYGVENASKCLNRTWIGIYIEWWLHNIGYYITKPFVNNEKIKSYNLRFKNVDLEGK